MDQSETSWMKRARSGFIVEDFSVEELSEEPALQGWTAVNGNTWILELSERHMDVGERAKFMAAKRKELQEFFDNSVWTYTDEIDPNRTMKARFILKWRTKDDGTMEAKARLVIQGFNDPDALDGKLETSSPTGTR